MIVGAGWVGRQVAARMAKYQIEVWLVDRSQAQVDHALAWLGKLQAKDEQAIHDPQPRRNRPYALDAEFPSESATHAYRSEMAGPWLARIHAAPSLAELSKAVESFPVDLVLECVPEQLSLKKRILRQVSQVYAPPVVIASNSSYFVPSLLAPHVFEPSRYAHFHFHVPVLHDSVADIVGNSDTSPEVLEQLRQLAIQLGLEPLMLRREHPGYIFNWMLQSLLKSALELAALDVADPSDIDKSWKAVTGMPLGPFGIMDQIGLDVIEQVLSNARWATPLKISDEKILQLIREHTAKGNFGTKSHQGFYSYEDEADLL